MVNFGYPYNDIVICKDSTDYLTVMTVSFDDIIYSQFIMAVIIALMTMGITLEAVMQCEYVIHIWIVVISADLLSTCVAR